MKYFAVALFLTFSLALVAQNETNMLSFTKNKYEQAWKTIDSLEQQGLPQSALAEVEQLYQRAKRENNPSQIIKTLIYKQKYQSQLEEDGDVKVIERLQAELATADFPVKPILQSMLGELYRNYLNMNRWRLSGRTEIADNRPEDIQTWSAEQLMEESSKLYLAALADSRIKRVPLSELDAITIKGTNSEGLWPTLYDFLAHRSIDHFTNEASYLNEPAYQFNIDQPEAFADVAVFTEFVFKNKNAESFKYQALQLFQELLNYHLNDTEPKALIDVDLKRLQFVHNNAIVANKDELYLEALDRLVNKHRAHPSAAEVIYRVAYFHFEKGQQYQPGPLAEKYRLEFKKAKEICDQCIGVYPNTFGAKQCQWLNAQIQRKELSVQIEDVNLPDQPMLAFVRYRNLSQIFFRAVKLSESDEEKLRSLDNEETLEFLIKRKSFRDWSVKLPNDRDFQNHSTEIAIDKLPIGHYAILASDNKKFNAKGGAAGYMISQVSNLAYMQRVQEGGSYEFVVVNRESGEPMPGVQAEFFKAEYTRRNQQERTSIAKGRSDENGFIRTNLPTNTSFSIRLMKENDILDSKQSYYSYYYSSTERKSYKQTHFFLDRTIYRPGQTVYFKALVTEKSANDMPRILPNEAVIITFYDANYQEVSKLELRTNEFGTVNGSFTAPKSGLLGQMHLAADTDEGEIYFNVEEYKRPKFEVVMQPLEQGYALGDSVEVSGTAKAYAGSNVNGATVRYRVTREVRYPWEPWWLWRRGGYPGSSETTEIANGETTTDGNGEFTIDFLAIPDLTADTTRNPMFVFNVSVDVIDITGETHSAEKTLNLGYLTLRADLTVPERIDRNNSPLLRISTTNLDGQPEPAQGTITIQRLQKPERTFIQRYWEQPDRYVLNKDQFYKLFPHYPYQNEDEPQHWEKITEIYNTNFDTKQSDSLQLNMRNWEVGHYAITLNTKDANGKPITVTKFFALHDAQTRQIPAHTLQWQKLNKQTFEPGEQMQIHLATTESPLHILYDQSNRSTSADSRWLRINNWETVTYNVSEADRGNLSYELNFVKYNRFFHEQTFVQVPWSNKDLTIEYSTFRDKLKPGQEEEWRIKISGAQKEQVAAEMVAAMYDASLDALTSPNDWSRSFYPTFYYSRRDSWSATLFGTEYLNLRAREWQPEVQFDGRTYPNLNWFNYYLGSGRYNYDMVMQRSTAMAAPAAANEALTYDRETYAEESLTLTSKEAKSPPPPPPAVEEVSEEPLTPPQPVRTNLKETVFFLPELQTDAEGNVIIKFTMNEALTRWKFLAFAHTKDLKFASSQREIVTQKELMVLPNPPRFMREGDEIYFTAKVSNLSEQPLAGKIRLELFDAITMQPVADKLGLKQQELDFSTKAGQSDAAEWRLQVPFGDISALTWRVTAQSGNFSDGEESSLPILTNRMLVTETLPMPVRAGQTKEFTLTNLRQAGDSKSLAHEALTLEFTANPAWYAVQALPYLMEYPYECVEQVFNRYYANALAASVANSTPKIKQIFERWKNTDALESNLMKNQELKTALLEETPWVLEAQSEAQQKKNIGILFDLMRLSEEQAATLNKIAEQQQEDGGFSWFPDGRSNWYITQYLVEGFGHLDNLRAGNLQDNPTAYQIIGKSIQFIDNRLAEAYTELEKQVKDGDAKWEDDHLSNIAIHYLYARSFFKQFPIENEVTKKAQEYYLSQAEKYWLNKGIYEEGLLALSTHRWNKATTAETIVKSLRERALRSEELGMYWKYNAGYFWHQMPIETHALMIEVFSEVAKDNEVVDELRVWLLKNKQTNSWETTKATAAAVYALLMNGSEWISDTEQVDISFPDMKRRESKQTIATAQQTAEPGTGYFKTSWESNEISTAMATVKVKNTGKTIAWGSLYWQYFEDLDQIKKFKETPLNIDKQVFREAYTDKGPVLKKITEQDPLEPGDKLIVRIELRVDRDMEFIHLKDMRASGLEPINVLSGYRWKNGLGYYESTGDVATNFFMDYLPKGTYVFEYPLRVVHKGDFSNGITSIQCMYAPEFASHSEGIRLTVGKVKN